MVWAEASRFSEHPFGPERQQTLPGLATDARIQLQFGQDVGAHARGPSGFVVLLAIHLHMGGDITISTFPCQAPCADAFATGNIQRSQIGVQAAQLGMVAGEQGVHIACVFQ